MKRKPKEYSADTGHHSKENHEFLKEEGIIDGIQYRGRKRKGVKGRVKKRTLVRMGRQRCGIEGKIGIMKSRYGCEKIRYKSENMEVRIYMAALMHNINWYMNG